MIFSFFKTRKTSLPPKVPLLYVDIHSHLIPAIDDGSKSMEESILFLKKLESLGYKKVITTPHIMLDTYNNTKKSVLEGLYTLQEESKRQDISLLIEAAAEYYLDEGLLPLIQKKEILLIADKYLLFETSYVHRPIQLEAVISEILSLGYIPLLAHPERYRYIDDPKEFHILKDLGVEFQVNLNSFTGYYGSHAKKHSHYLSKEGLINFLGSDTHNIKQLENLKYVLNSDIYKEVYLFNKIKNKELL